MNAPKTGPIHVGVMVWPQFAAMDVFGVHTVFGTPPCLGLRPDVTVHLIGKTLDEFGAVPPWPMRPTTTFADCPRPLDVLAVGAMPPSLFEDDEAMDFVAAAGAEAGYLLGVCAGSFVLGAAGLLRGYRATTNFHSLGRLGVTGAIPTAGHVVVDRNRYTTGPVVGALDASLMILGELCGPEVARELELHLEHLAEPPFGTGRPDRAGPELTARALGRLEGMMAASDAVAAACCRRRGVAI